MAPGMHQEFECANFEMNLNHGGPVSEEQEEEIGRSILRYLQEHPDAKDTLEGIAQWWVLKEWSALRFAAVERAVTILLAKDLIVETRREGSPPYYRLNQDKKRLISRIIEE